MLVLLTTLVTGNLAPPAIPPAAAEMIEATLREADAPGLSVAQPKTVLDVATHTAGLTAPQVAAGCGSCPRGSLQAR